MRIADLPAEERADATEHARRAARFKYAKDRISKIAGGAPAFTAEQRADLAALLVPAPAESNPTT